jgi:predicted MPP superfamily phosphohydrolase
MNEHHIIDTHPSPRRMRLDILALAIFLTLAIWGFVWEPAQLVRRDYVLSLPNWPKECSGLRVAVVADLHAGSPHIDLAKVDQVVRMVDDSDADIVLLAGDYVIQSVVGGRYIPISDVAPHLHALTLHKPVYAVLGNHDWWRGGVTSRRALHAVGITVLEDQSTEIQHGACHFWLAGIGDFVTAPHNVGKALAGIPPGQAILALTHEPRLFPKIPARVALLIAGHTHGGQIRLPLGWLSGPRLSTQWNAHGHIVEGGRHLFVSTGIGTSHMGVRIGVPPEVSMLTLNAQAR